MPQDDFISKVEELAERDGRFKKAAYLFVYDALEYTVKKLGKAAFQPDQRHISGQELLYGISEYGLEQFGPLTREVFRRWGLDATRNFGEIVFNLIQAGLMTKTDKDNLDDFTDIYSFSEEFNWKKRKSNYKRLPQQSGT
jgi:uncharacterized repeat protein (TIGR04138 family)